MMIHEGLTREIISAFYEVHKILGFGFLEQVYQNALYKELCRRNLKCECQKELNVYYKNEIVGHTIYFNPYEYVSRLLIPVIHLRISLNLHVSINFSLLLPFSSSFSFHAGMTPA